MQSATPDTIPTWPGTGSVEPARVVAADTGDGRLEVLLCDGEPHGEAKAGGTRCRARLANPSLGPLGWGAAVLVARDGEGAAYVIGVLDLPAETAEPPPPSREIVAEGGARAELADSEAGEQLRVLSPTGEILFEYDAQTGGARVGVPAGDLEIAARRGRIDLVSERGIRLCSREAIELTSLAGVKLAVPDRAGADASAVAVDAERVALTGRALEASAAEGRLNVGQLEYAGQRLSALVHTVKIAAKRSESFAETAIERAGNLYRSVRELAQLDAGRVRTLVKGIYQLRSEDALLKSEQDFKIQGEKIHLG